MNMKTTKDKRDELLNQDWETPLRKHPDPDGLVRRINMFITAVEDGRESEAWSLWAIVAMDLPPDLRYHILDLWNVHKETGEGTAPIKRECDRLITFIQTGEVK